MLFTFCLDELRGSRRTVKDGEKSCSNLTFPTVGAPHLPTVILVCMLSLSTSTLLRMTASSATRMYVRLMSKTMDDPATHKMEGVSAAGASGGSAESSALNQAATFKLVVQVVHVGDEAVVGKQEAHAGQ